MHPFNSAVMKVKGCLHFSLFSSYPVKLCTQRKARRIVKQKQNRQAKAQYLLHTIYLCGDMVEDRVYIVAATELSMFILFEISHVENSEEEVLRPDSISMSTMGDNPKQELEAFVIISQPKAAQTIATFAV
jgi:hypothetical protein